ncbi:MAG: biotin--[acetyl-CoA-carboxylase] ligase [Cytophagales bacterium]|nr:biotin--[acetyl-CoA-carboxylase] ligase [Cytophagales bacterium]
MYLPICHSTNDYIKENIDNINMKNGTIAIAREQTNGRGQRGNKWVSNPGENLTFSILIDNAFEHSFVLTQLISVSVCEVLLSYSINNIAVKWPNDILVGHKKLCGILIEKYKNKYIAGIGINVNQQNFGYLNATSMYNECEHNFDIYKVLNEVCINIENNLPDVQNLNILRTKYLNLLFGYQKQRTYMYDGKTCTGIIEKIYDDGKIGMDIDGNKLILGNREIKYVL